MPAKRKTGRRNSGAGRTYQLDYPNYDLGAHYRFALRDKMYNALENRFIPQDLVDWARTGAPHAELRWLIPPLGNASIAEAEFEVLEESAGSEKNELLLRGARLDEPPKTVGEALACFLSEELSRLRRAKNAPVRVGKLLPRSTIAWIAFDLVTSHELLPPGPYLRELLFDLLDIARPTEEEIDQYAARYRAACILAQAPELNSEEIARELGVNRSSVSRWRADPKFQEWVSHIRANRARRT